MPEQDAASILQQIVDHILQGRTTRLSVAQGDIEVYLTPLALLGELALLVSVPQFGCFKWVFDKPVTKFKLVSSGIPIIVAEELSTVLKEVTLTLIKVRNERSNVPQGHIEGD